MSYSEHQAVIDVSLLRMQCEVYAAIYSWIHMIPLTCFQTVYLSLQ